MKSTKITFTALVFCLISSINNTIAQNSDEKIKTQIDDIFSNWNHKNKPGASVSVVKDGKLFYTKGYGSANLEYDIPITSKTVFHAASLSKQFTAFAILLLEEQGKLSLDDDVRKYIPEVPDFGKKITLKHLASHSSGLRDQWRLLELAGWRMDDVIKTKQILELVEKQEALNFLPGDENMYSNTGFTLLAEVVARVSKQSFAEFTKQHIFIPLGMNNTQFYDDHEKIVKNRAYSYQKEDYGFKKSRLNFSTVGPTSLFTTAEDMSLWAFNFQNPKVGSKATFNKLNTPPDLNNAKGKGYALGQIKGTYQGIKVFVHSGSDAGYRAYFVRFPEHNISVTVLANLSSMNPIEQAFGVANLFVSNYFEPATDKKKEIFKHNTKNFISLNKKKLKQFEGKYYEPLEGYDRKVYIKNDTLIYYRSESSESKLVPIAVNKFKMLDDSEDVTVEFTKNKNGESLLKFYVNDNEPILMLAYNKVNLTEYKGVFKSKELDTHYSFFVEDDKLVAKHLRLDDIVLKPVQKDVFISNNRNFKNVRFTRNKRNKIIGILISNSGAKNVNFIKAR